MINSNAFQPVTINETRINSFVAQTYLVMSFGLLVTGIVAYCCGSKRSHPLF